MHVEQPGCLDFANDFTVGEWRVEPSLNRVSRNGAVVHLRPQLIDLLVVLARHAGTTVSKDVLLEKVWDGQCVAESGMTRCIAEIRQVLEDDAREPKFIQTIPKRGYRLVAPVQFIDSHGSAPSSDPKPQTVTPLTDSESGPEWPIELPGPQRPARRVSWTTGSIVGATLLIAGTWGSSGWTRVPVLSTRDTVLLADTTNTTGDSAFDGTLRLALGVHLGQAPFLRILSDDRVRSALTLMGRSSDQPVVGPVALEVCRREGAAVLLAGSIARMGSHYAVGIEAIACRTGEPIDRELVEVNGKEQVLTELGTAAVRLRLKLGESRASLLQYDVPIVRATTPSLEALRALSLGDIDRDHARLGDALKSYRRATDLDPQFALAWARRGAAAYNLGPSVGNDRFGSTDEPTFAFRKAYELRDRVSEPERFYILGHYYRFVASDPEKAIETYKMWKRSYPGSVVPPTNLASLYIGTYGQYDAALAEAQEAVRLSPYSSLAYKMLIVAYLGTDRVPEARLALREAAIHGVADLLWHGLAFQMAFTDGDTPAMLEHARWASADASANIAITEYRALAAASSGRLREARQLWSEAASQAAQARTPALQAGIRVMEAETEALLGDAHAARAAAEAALAVDQQPGTLRLAAIAFALSGDPVRAARLVDDASRLPEAGTCAKFVWLPVARALVEARSGRPGRAREILLQAAPFERGRNFGLTPLGVRASIALTAGRSMEAAEIFQELLRLRVVAPTSPWVAFARLGIARALRDSGDERGSQAAYDAAIDSMHTADADAPLLIAARRERAALSSR